MSSPGLAYNFRPKMSLPERIISCRSTSRLSVFREKVDSFDFIQNDSVNDESQKQTFFFLLFFILCLLNRYRIDSKSSLSKIEKSSSTDKRKNNSSCCSHPLGNEKIEKSSSTDKRKNNASRCVALILSGNVKTTKR